MVKDWETIERDMRKNTPKRLWPLFGWWTDHKTGKMKKGGKK